MKPEWQDAKISMKFQFRYLDEKIVDGVSFGRLEVKWSNGSLGAYIDVNRRTYEDFVASESRGKFLNRVIKPGFKYERTGAVADAKSQDEAKTPEEPSDAAE